jgi:hypothetical protein
MAAWAAAAVQRDENVAEAARIDDSIWNTSREIERRSDRLETVAGLQSAANRTSGTEHDFLDAVVKAAQAAKDARNSEDESLLSKANDAYKQLNDEQKGMFNRVDDNEKIIELLSDQRASDKKSSKELQQLIADNELAAKSALARLARQLGLPESAVANALSEPDSRVGKLMMQEFSRQQRQFKEQQRRAEERKLRIAWTRYGSTRDFASGLIQQSHAVRDAATYARNEFKHLLSNPAAAPHARAGMADAKIAAKLAKAARAAAKRVDAATRTGDPGAVKEATEDAERRGKISKAASAVVEADKRAAYVAANPNEKATTQTAIQSTADATVLDAKLKLATLQADDPKADESDPETKKLKDDVKNLKEKLAEAKAKAQLAIDAAFALDPSSIAFTTWPYCPTGFPPDCNCLYPCEPPYQEIKSYPRPPCADPEDENADAKKDVAGGHGGKGHGVPLQELHDYAPIGEAGPIAPPPVWTDDSHRYGVPDEGYPGEGGSIFGSAPATPPAGPGQVLAKPQDAPAVPIPVSGPKVPPPVAAPASAGGGDANANAQAKAARAAATKARLRRLTTRVAALRALLQEYMREVLQRAGYLKDLLSRIDYVAGHSNAESAGLPHFAAVTREYYTFLQEAKRLLSTSALRPVQRGLELTDRVLRKLQRLDSLALSSEQRVTRAERELDRLDLIVADGEAWRQAAAAEVAVARFVAETASGIERLSVGYQFVGDLMVPTHKRIVSAMQDALLRGPANVLPQVIGLGGLIARAHVTGGQLVFPAERRVKRPISRLKNLIDVQYRAMLESKVIPVIDREERREKAIRFVELVDLVGSVIGGTIVTLDGIAKLLASGGGGGGGLRLATVGVGTIELDNVASLEMARSVAVTGSATAVSATELYVSATGPGDEFSEPDRPSGSGGGSAAERPIDPDTGKPYRDREWRGKNLFEQERGTELHAKESPDQAGDFIDGKKQTYDFLGPLDDNTPHKLTEVLESLKGKVLTLKSNSVDFVVVDFRGYNANVVAEMRVYLDSLPSDLRWRVFTQGR